VSNVQARHLALGVRLVFFTVAVLALRHELAGVDRLDVVAGVRSLGPFQIAAALGFTAASFLTLGSLELLTLRHIGGHGTHAVRRRTAISTAYVAHAFSQSAGFAILTGAVIRLRAYVRYGVAAVSVARLSAFVTLTMTLGLLAITGIALLTGDAMFAAHRGMRSGITGAVLILPPLAYLAWSVFGRQSGIGHGPWRVPRPSPGLAGGQIALSALDWLIAGMVLFVLLPARFAAPYSTFLTAYMLAQAVGFVSQIPGGIGAFDATLLAFLAPFAGIGALAASLVIYRIIYYLLPLCAAIAVFGFGEWRSRTPAPATGAPNA
jgi:phosphatidylglycerol lysyltransferase